MAYLGLTAQVLNESSMLEQAPPSIEDEECLITGPWNLCATLRASEWKRLRDMIVSALWTIHLGK